MISSCLSEQSKAEVMSQIYFAQGLINDLIKIRGGITMKLKKSLLILVTFLIAGMMVAGGCGLFGGDDQSSPEQVVEGYFEAFKNKDFRAALDLTVDGDQVGAEELEMLETVFEEFEIIDYEIGEIKSLSSTEVLVPVTITSSFGGDESVSTDEFSVVEIDGQWYLDEGTSDDDDWDDRDAGIEFDEDALDDIDFDDLEIDPELEESDEDETEDDEDE